MIPDYLGPGQDLDPMSHTILPWCHRIENICPFTAEVELQVSPLTSFITEFSETTNFVRDQDQD